ncbi:MAG: sterol desaturase family protein [Gammaproteobacteria bacterium]|nr:sterol desaturase family protein [Gammaproteobacteria bacterium]MDH4255604.1 sterol desaturase family protein [Gammaproteobacteria bacterium]MDH5310996.1 sterol desaturase family protein [Gammaproteobacteria bacterium]
MDLIALAVPFFLLALLIELAVDRWRGTGYYRANDAVNSLSAGTLSTTIGYFTRLLPVYIYGAALANFAIFEFKLEWFDLSPRGILLWVAAILAWDFCYYWSHRMGHEISILWASHAVHHQSEDYNLSTALRQTSTGFLFNWIFYVPLFLAGLPLEVVATANAIDLIYQFWVHTQHVGKLGWLDRVFVTPSNHRVHHAQNQVYIDRNYGGILILWDRLFGSFQEELDEEPVVFGVRKPLANWNPFWANLQVYDYLWFDARRTRHWRDKLGIWFRRTGWRPADVAAAWPKPATDLAHFRKFDPPLGAAIKRYLVWQFVAAAGAVLWIGRLFAEEGATAVLLPCLLLWATLYTLGLLSEGRRYARTFEILRLALVLPLGTAALAAQGRLDLQGPGAVLLVAYLAASAAGLWYSARIPAPSSVILTDIKQ